MLLWFLIIQVDKNKIAGTRNVRTHRRPHSLVTSFLCRSSSFTKRINVHMGIECILCTSPYFTYQRCIPEFSYAASPGLGASPKSEQIIQRRTTFPPIAGRIPYRRKIGHISIVDDMEAHGKTKEDDDERHEKKKNVRQCPEDGQRDDIQT